MPEAVEIRSLHPPGPARAPAVPEPELGGGELKLGDGDSPTFADLLDIINPLQHIPVINTIYRQLTGDTIKPAMQLIGSTLFGGPVGAVVAFSNLALAHISGRDLGEHAVAFAESAFGGNPAPTQIAADIEAGFQTAAGPEPATQARPESMAAAPLPAAANPEPVAQVMAAPAAAAQASGAAQPAVRLGADALLAFRADLAAVARSAGVPASTPPGPDAPPRPSEQRRAAPAASPTASVGTATDMRPAERAQQDAEVARLMSQRLAQRQMDGAADRGRPNPLLNRGAGQTPPPVGTTAAAPPATAPASATGAVGVQGGWLTDAMLGALQKYEQAKALNAAAHATPAANAGPARAADAVH